MGSELTCSVAEAVADQLARAKVDRVFGLPGGEILSMMDALRRREIAFTLCRHESYAGIMAAVYGKLTGTVGVVLTTLGPGAANLMLPVANSLLDREPLLAISADVPIAWPASHTHQRLPLLDMFGAVAKFTGRINSFNARSIVEQAIASCMDQPLGPAYLTLSADDALSPALESVSVCRVVSSGVTAAPMTFGNPVTAAKALRRRIKEAKRPLVLLGLGVRPDRAVTLRSWIDRWNLPVAVTPKAKGLVDETNGNFVGVIGGMSVDSLILEALYHSDLLIGFGFDPVEVDKMWHAHLPCVWVLESPQAMGVVPKSDLIGVDHGALLNILSTEDAPRRWEDSFEDVKERRRELYRRGGASVSDISIPASSRGDGTVQPVELVRVLAEALPRDTVVVTDVGAHKYVFGQFWPSRSPESFLMSNGLSGMGYGLPAAIGAKLARPNEPVLAVMGDGGFSMYSQELETARRNRVQVTAIVIADRSYSLIRTGQHARGLPNIGVDFEPIDTVRTSEACGIRGLRVQTEQEAAAALDQAMTTGESLVVEVEVDPESYRGIV